jgi:hypothetical protein
MSCPSCGAKVGENDNFCSACGKNLKREEETELFSFGPWGTGVCFSRPSFLTMIQKNDTKIVFTNRRISGYSSFTNSLRFQVPYEAIISEEVFAYMLWRVLWIQYQDGAKTREVSIMCTAGNHEHIAKAYDLIVAQKALNREHRK